MSAKELRSRTDADVRAQLVRFSQMLTVAAGERQCLRTALAGCIAALEDLQAGHGQDPMFAEHGDAAKAMKHGRQLLRPGGVDRAMTKKGR